MESRRNGVFAVAAAWAFLLVFFAGVSEGAVMYVTPGGSGSRNGTSWSQALGEIEFPSELEAAASGTEFWVAAGTYSPTTNPSERLASFHMKNGVALYGGFAGTETSRDEREWDTHVTILTGDIDGNDSSGGDNSGNAYHVVDGRHTDNTAILDGFTVTGGNADGGNDLVNGGGMYNDQGSPTVANCVFLRNNAANSGGGMSNAQSDSVSVTNCSFIGNTASITGGGISNYDSHGVIAGCTFSGNSISDYFSGVGGGGLYLYLGTAMVTGCTFTENSAEISNGGNGGGIYSYSSDIRLEDCVLSGNAAYMRGGGMYLYKGSSEVAECTFSLNGAAEGGGIFNDQSSPAVTRSTFSENTGYRYYGGGMYNSQSSPSVENCTFSRNTAQSEGGGMCNNQGSPSVVNCTFFENSASDAGGGMANFNASRPVLVNCTFSGNSAEFAGGGIYNTSSSSPVLTNCILWDDSGGEIGNDSSSPAVSSCVIQGGYPGGTSIIAADPLLGTLAHNGGPTMTCALEAGSSAMDTGTLSGAPATDQRGVSRPQGKGLDIGAYEYAFSATPVLLFPGDGATGVPLELTLRTAAYEPPTGFSHFATRWQMGTEKGFESGLMLDETSESALTGLDVPEGTLEYGTTYFWRVRFQDSLGLWSGWSGTWSFTTVERPSSPSSGGGCGASGFIPPMLLLLVPLFLFLRGR